MTRNSSSANWDFWAWSDFRTNIEKWDDMYARAINSELYDKKIGRLETLSLTNNNQELRQLVEWLERQRKRTVESVPMERHEKKPVTIEGGGMDRSLTQRVLLHSESGWLTSNVAS